MSLWTPDGEHPVDRDRPATDPGPTAGPDILDGLSEEQRAEFARLSPEDQEQAKLLIAQMAESRRQLLETPAAVVVANHAMGLYELAAIHLSAKPPNLPAASLAIDAVGILVDGLGDRLGPDSKTLRDALSNIRMAFVGIKSAAATASSEATDGGGDDAAAGEAAPILLVGAATGLLRTGSQSFAERLTGPFTALPVAIFSYARQPGDAFREVTAAASVVLMVLVLIMNGFAIWLRNRYERKW